MAYRGYWITWVILLVVTLSMILVGGSAVPTWLLVAFILTAMSVKAGLIGAQFMHLRSESRALVLIVVLGLAAVGAALFAGISPDAIRTLALRAR